MPDLSVLARVVDDQIRNLVGVGRRIASQPGSDEKLKKEMPEACDDVSKASELLVTSTTKLVKDPHSNTGRQHLLESVKGILKGTTSILSVFDDAEVRRVITTSMQVRNQVTSLTEFIPMVPPSVFQQSSGLAAAFGKQLQPAQQLDPKQLAMIPPAVPTPAELAIKKHVHDVAVCAQTVVSLGQMTLKRVAELLHPTLQSRLKAAVATLVRESPMLISACRVALANPGLSEAVRVRAGCAKRMIEACEEIEVVVMFTTEEEGLGGHAASEVKPAAKKLEECQGAIRSAVASGSLPELEKALGDYKKVNSAILADMKKSLRLLSNPTQRSEMQTLIDSLESFEPKLTQSSYQALTKPDNMKSQQELLSIMDDCTIRHRQLAGIRNQGLVGDLTTLVSGLSDRRKAAGGSAFGGIHEAACKGNRPGVSNAVHDFGEEARRLCKLTGMAVGGGSGAVGNNKVAVGVGLDSSVGDGNEGDPSFPMFPGGDQNVDSGAIKKKKRTLSGPGPGVQNLGNGVGLVSMAAITSPEISMDVSNLSRRLEELRPAVEMSATMLVINPNEETARAHMDKVCDAWEEVVKDLQGVLVGQEGAFKAHELVTGTERAFEIHADGLADAMKCGDVDRAQKEAGKLMSSAMQFVAIAKKEVEYTDDSAYKASLEVRIKDVERILPQLLARGQTFIDTRKTSASDMTDLQSNIRDLVGKFLGLGELIRAHKGIRPDEVRMEQQEALLAPTELAIQGISVKVLEHAMNDVVICDEEAPRLLSEAEAKVNPIQAAAQELKVEASHWSTKSNPIITAATKMSDHLTSLSLHHLQLRKDPTPESKKSFIQAAKEIHDESIQLTTSARPLSEKCSDRRLRVQLSGTLDRVVTLSQQLKIVAAVKASAPNDTDRDSQLIACAQNLMMAAKSCIRESEASSLRVGSSSSGSSVPSANGGTSGSAATGSAAGAGSTANGNKSNGAAGGEVAPIKFRRAVYRTRRAGAAR
ncbi:hypothetical protein HDU76_013588 [Blyttiomyces sp. JEL0837]|nr:hypothetical protein HDU76_013588 [Blyttiomyces sp. JEL0837]